MKNLGVAVAVMMALAPATSLFAAQYKWMDGEGRVHYSDRLPPPGGKLLKGGTEVITAQTPGDPTLPYALRIVTAKSPVVLYTGQECAPCDSARMQLSKRGVPFTEVKVATPADVQAMKKRGFDDPKLPSISVGGQKQTGYEEGSLAAMLDAAGYPKSSMLPPGYRAAAARSADRAKGNKNTKTEEAKANADDARQMTADAGETARQDAGSNKTAARKAPPQIATDAPPAVGPAPAGFKF